MQVNKKVHFNIKQLCSSLGFLVGPLFCKPNLSRASIQYRPSLVKQTLPSFVREMLSIC